MEVQVIHQRNEKLEENGQISVNESILSLATSDISNNTGI
jgi:hypothetical protein